jgi:hypothetical protein
MKHPNVVSVAAALGLACMLAACGGGNNKNTTANQAAPVQQANPAHVAHNEMSGRNMQINMGQQNKSNETGNAGVVDAKSGGVDVTIRLNHAPKGVAQPAHIHKGTCAKLDPAPWKPLTSVVDGKSFTHLAGVTVAEIKKGKYAINVHKSANDLKTYVSCGDLVL